MPNPPSEKSVPNTQHTSDKPETYTNWKALAKAGLVPVRISCQAYKPYHGGDQSCHTALKMDAATIQRHFVAEHGGGFQFFLKVTDGKASPLWDELSTSGLEAHDFRCEVCDAVLKFNPGSILPHMKSHRGKTRQAYAILARDRAPATGFFDVTIAKAALPEDEDDTL